MATRSVPRAEAPDREQTSLDVVLHCLASALAADTGVLLGYDDAGKKQLLSAWGLAETKSTVPWVSSSFLGRAMKADGPTLLPANESDGPGWSGVAAPIQGIHGPLGGIYAGFERPSALDPEHLRWTVRSHAILAGLCMAGGPGVAMALRSAGLDQLTGCLSYPRTLEMLATEVERSRRLGHKLSCCFLDLDGFKKVNDAHGHLEGNRVLSAAGAALRAGARPYDLVGRFGGDEFVIILPETGAASARSAVDRMRWKVTFAVQEATATVLEASAGIAELQADGSMLGLLEASDQALQRAKAAGGGRVVISGNGEKRFDGLLELTRTVVRGSGGPPSQGPL